MLHISVTPRTATLIQGVAMALLLAACSTPLPPPKPVEPPVSVAPPPPPVVAPPPVAPPERVSQARSARDYRRDAAGHLYARNKDRIWAGKMPPLLHAVGVLQVDIDARGNVTAINWMRAPSHAPDVMATIEKAVRQAAPYPAPTYLGRVTYTDTWLWHKSGQFQLDTLTEGQL